jgi:hypothetical protein
MKLPDLILKFLYKTFGIMNCKKCGELMVNPSYDKIAKHIEKKHEDST